MHDMPQSRKRASIHGCGTDCFWKQFRKNNWQLGKAISLSIHTPFLSPFRSLVYTKSTISDILSMMHYFSLILLPLSFIALSTSQDTITSLKLPLKPRNAGISVVQSSVSLSQWDINVVIGGQNVTLDIDTGSSFL